MIWKQDVSSVVLVTLGLAMLGEVYGLMPSGGRAKDRHKAQWDFEKLYDGKYWLTSVPSDSCYHSASTSGSWVELYLSDKFDISVVKILNRGDCCGSRTVGLEVKVCMGSGDANCQLCGTISSAPNGEWIRTSCPSMTRGNSIRLEHKTQYINICEVEFEGGRVVGPEGLTNLIPSGGASDGLMKPEWGVDKLYDGSSSTSVPDNSCYHSPGSGDSWVELYVADDSQVSSVSILNRGDCCGDRIIGMNIKVCQGAGSSNCKLCGTVSKGPEGQWITTVCPPGTSGGNVRLERSGNFINICEVKIKGVAPVGPVQLELGCSLAPPEEIWIVNLYTHYYGGNARYIARPGGRDGLTEYNDGWDDKEWEAKRPTFSGVRTSPASGYKEMVIAKRTSEQYGLYSIVGEPALFPMFDYTVIGSYYFCIDQSACPGAQEMSYCTSAYGSYPVRGHSCPDAAYPTILRFFAHEIEYAPCDLIDGGPVGQVNCKSTNQDSVFRNIVQYKARDLAGLDNYKYRSLPYAQMGDSNGWNWMFSFWVKDHSSIPGFDKSMELIRRSSAPWEAYFQPESDQVPDGFTRTLHTVCVDPNICQGFVLVRSCLTPIGSFITCAPACPQGSDQLAEFFTGIEGDAAL